MKKRLMNVDIHWHFQDIFGERYSEDAGGITFVEFVRIMVARREQNRRFVPTAGIWCHGRARGLSLWFGFRGALLWNPVLCRYGPVKAKFALFDPKRKGHVTSETAYPVLKQWVYLVGQTTPVYGATSTNIRIFRTVTGTVLFYGFQGEKCKTGKNQLKRIFSWEWSGKNEIRIDFPLLSLKCGEDESHSCKDNISDASSPQFIANNWTPADSNQMPIAWK